MSMKQKNDIIMVHILDGNFKQIAQRKQVFSGNNFKFATNVDINHSLQNCKLQTLLYLGAHLFLSN